MKLVPSIQNRISRREFLRLAAILGLTFGTDVGAAKEAKTAEKVIIVGAGAAGMSAAYLLARQGINYEILEASPGYGGRFRVNKTFTDFPLPLGAEWLHVPASEFNEILDDQAASPAVEMRPYNNDDILGYYAKGNYNVSPLGDSGDQKFIGSSWFDFFDTYIVPTIREQMRFQVEVTEINYSGSQVVLTDNRGRRHSADRVISTIPARLLQLEKIQFLPPLPKKKKQALKKANIWSGIKIFIEFSEKFFPTVLAFPDSDTKHGQRYIYDASVGQNTNSHILGVFAVGNHAERYQRLPEEERIAAVLTELDQIFRGAASASYVKHLVQDWNSQEYAKAAYLADVSPSWIPRALSTSVADKLFFAGEAFTEGDDWGGVHDAARSARAAVREIRIKNHVPRR